MKALAAGETTEEQVIEKIHEAGELVVRVRELLEAAGDIRENKAFLARCAAIFTEPLDPSPEAAEIRSQLQVAMKALEDLLDRDFRVE